MKALSNWRFLAVTQLAIAATVGFGFACSSGSEDGASPTVSTTFVPRAEAGTDAAPPVELDGAPDVVGPQPLALPPGCFAGVPTTSLQFMNACTDSDYAPFDNCARLGLCGGALLPTLLTPPVDAGPG